MSTKDLCTPLNESNAKSLVNNNDTFLFDCDGVLWNYPDIFPGAIELLHHLTQQVKQRNRTFSLIKSDSVLFRSG